MGLMRMAMIGSVLEKLYLVIPSVEETRALLAAGKDAVPDDLHCIGRLTVIDCMRDSWKLTARVVRRR
jgi:hypothetical protein